jgi:hypothetical protein
MTRLALSRAQHVFARIDDVFDRNAADHVPAGTETVFDARPVQIDAGGHGMLPRQFVDKTRAATDRGAAIGIGIFETGPHVGGKRCRRSEDTGFFEQDGRLVVQLVGRSLADPGDRTFDAQFFRLAEQVAMTPVAFEAGTVGAGDRRTQTDGALFAFADFEDDRVAAVGIQHLDRFHGDPVKNVQCDQPVAATSYLLRAVDPAGFDIGIFGGKLGVHVLGARNLRGPERRDRPGIDLQHHIQLCGRVVGKNLAARNPCKRMAVFLQHPDH